MIKENKKKWLELFYDRWCYKPLLVIRKKPEYKGKIELSRALYMISDANQQFLIRIAFPFETHFPVDKNLSNSIIIFPQTVSCNKKDLYEIEEPILYKEAFYSLDNFIIKYRNLRPQTDDNMFGTYVFSLPFFMLSPEEINYFRRLYLTPIRNRIVEAGVYPEVRGKGKNKSLARVERDKFIIKEYKSIGRKKPLPVTEISNRLSIIAMKEFDPGSVKYKEFNCKDITIRRVLQRYTAK